MRSGVTRRANDHRNPGNLLCFLLGCHRNTAPTNRRIPGALNWAHSLSLKCILRALPWICEGALGRKRERRGWGLEAAEVAGLRPPGGDGGENKFTEAETGPQHPRPAQIPMCACENTRPKHRAAGKVVAMRTGAAAHCPPREADFYPAVVPRALTARAAAGALQHLSGTMHYSAHAGQGGWPI